MAKQKYSTAPFKEIDESKRKSKGQVWCPYCGDFKSFIPKEVECYPRCTGCGISDQDYWVMHVNKLWEISIKPR